MRGHATAALMALVLVGGWLPAQSSTCPTSTELGNGSTTAGIGGAGGAGGRGGVRQYTGPGAVLTSFSQEFTLATPGETTFQVHEGPTATGPWALIDETVVPAGLSGRAEYDSGPMNVPLVTGQYYAIIAYANSDTDYHYGSAGTVYTDWVHISRIYDNNYPPATFIISGTSDCHQWVCTGGLVVNQVDTAPTTVYQGQSGIPVTVELESLATSPIDTLAATLSFMGTADRTSEYVVTPDPGNPTTLAPGAVATLGFSVDVSVMATTEAITLDASASGHDTGLGTTVQAAGAVTTDSWDVLGPIIAILQVDAPDPVVVAGLGGYPVAMTVENPGINTLTIDSANLTFMGTADCTSEYVVTPDPGNPTSLAAGASDTLDFLVDVTLAATRQTITLDGVVYVTDTVTAATAMDTGADLTDTWDVTGCSAPTCGDCNGDLSLTILDALVAAQHAAGIATLTGIDFSNCNVTGLLEPDPGAVVTILDALSLAQVAAGLGVTLACC